MLTDIRSGGNLYQRYFGSVPSEAVALGVDENRWKGKLQENFESIYSWIDSGLKFYEGSVSDCVDEDTGRPAYAYSYTFSPIVYKCALYKSAPRLGRNSKAGTVVHEASHIADVGDDIAYGYGPSLGLAIDNPLYAFLNADNYAYYAEDMWKP